MRISNVKSIRFAVLLMVLAVVRPAVVRGDGPINQAGNNANITVNANQTIESSNANEPAISLGRGTIDNFGTIYHNQNASGETAIRVGNDAVVSNLGANSNITGRVEFGAAEGGSSRVFNEGTINGEIEFNTLGTGSASVENFGTINGFADSAIRVNGSSTDEIILRSGSQTNGSIDVGRSGDDDDDGADRVVVEAGATLFANSNAAITLTGGTVENRGNINSQDQGIVFRDDSNDNHARRVENDGTIQTQVGNAIDDQAGFEVSTVVINTGTISAACGNVAVSVRRSVTCANTSYVQIDNLLANQNNSNNANGNSSISGRNGVVLGGNLEGHVTNQGTITGTDGDGIRINGETQSSEVAHVINNTGEISSSGDYNAAVDVSHSSGDGNAASVEINNTGSSANITGPSGIVVEGNLRTTIENQGTIAATTTRDPMMLLDGGIAIDVSTGSNDGAGLTINNTGLITSNDQAIRFAQACGAAPAEFTLTNGSDEILPTALPQDLDQPTITGTGGVYVTGQVSTSITNFGLIEATAIGDDDDDGRGVGVSAFSESNGDAVHHFLDNQGTIRGTFGGVGLGSEDAAPGSTVTVRNGVVAQPSALPQEVNSALIEGAFAGLGVFGDVTVDLDNRGTIRGTNGSGVQLELSTSPSLAVHHVIDNRGLIESYTDAGISAGVLDGNSASTFSLTNSGEITGRRGVEMETSSSVAINNSGSITAVGDDDDDDDGIFVAAGRAEALAHTIENSGTITGGEFGAGIAGYFSSGNRSTLSILNSGTITGGGGIDLVTYNTAVTIENSGIIHANDTVAISLGDDDDDDDDAPVTVTNSGSIVSTNSAAFVYNGFGNVDFTSTGLVSAVGPVAIALGSGDDTVTLGDGSTTIGGIFGGNGANTLSFAGAGSLEGDVISVQTINKTGEGTFVWSGNASADELPIDLNVSGGTLQINPFEGNFFAEVGPQVLAPEGVLGADTTITNGATLFVNDGAHLQVNNLDVDGPGSTLIVGAGGAGALVDDGDGASETTATFTNGAHFEVAQNSQFLFRDLSMENSTGLVAGEAVVSNSLVMVDSNIHVTSTGSFEALNDTTLINSTLTVDEGGFITSADAITYNNSVVTVNGRQGGSIVLGAGSRLKGSGTIVGDATLLSGSTLAAGNSPGTLNVGGNLTLNAGTTTEVELSPTANDRVNVGGVATLGGTLQVIQFESLAGLRGTTVFTIIDAPNNPIQGSFAAINGLSDLPIMSLTARQNTNSFELVFTRNAYDNFQRSENERSAALYFDRFPVTNTALAGLTNAIDVQTTAANVAFALDQVHAEPFDVLPNVAFQHAQQYASQMENYLYTARLNLKRQNAAVAGQATASKLSASTPAVASGSVVPDYGTRNSMFSDPNSKYGGYGYAYSLESDQNTIRNGLGQTLRSGSETSDRGIQAGVDKRISDELVVGVSLGTGDTTSDLRDGRGRFDGDQWQLGAYATWAREDSYIDALLTYNDYDVDSLRAVAFTGFNNVLRSNIDMRSVSGYIGGGWMSHNTGSWNWGPTASLQWTNTDVDGFTETGGVAALTVSGRTVDSIRSQVGVRATRKYDFGKDRQVIPELRARWSHEFANDDRNIVAGFAAAPGVLPFTSVSASPDRDTFFVGGSVNGYFAKNFSGFINYDAELGRQGGSLHAGRGGLTFKF